MKNLVATFADFGFEEARAIGPADLEAGQRWGLWPRGSETIDRQEALSASAQVQRDYGRWFTCIDAPRAQVAAGSIHRAGRIEFCEVAVTSRTGYTPIGVFARDGRVENTGLESRWLHRDPPPRLGPDEGLFMGMHERKFSLKVLDPGKPPILFEPIEAEVAIGHGKKLAVTPIDAGTGKSSGAAVEVSHSNCASRFHIGAGEKAVVYEIHPGD